ncbi:MAG TPA: CHAT domain-containing protein [Solirubrobacteraceae bacterium]|nr:CHAT domain-containing protein [Solirubrobacteraceae bacterium]
MSARSDSDTDAAIFAELVRRGPWLLADLPETEAIAAAEMLLEWLDGRRSTGAVDEAERRWAAAMSALYSCELELPGLRRLTARAMLELPDDHDEKDTELALRLLAEQRELSRREGDAYEELRAIAASLSSKLEDPASEDELLAAGRSLAGGLADADAADEFHVEAASMLLGRLIEARDEGDAAAEERIANEARAELSEVSPDRMAARADSGALATLAGVLDTLEDWEEAVLLWERIADGGRGNPAAGVRGAEVRLRLGQHAAAVEAAQSVIGTLRDYYLRAVFPAELEVGGEQLGSAATCLAFAHARLGAWDAALRALDTAKSLRTRHRIALRASDRGERAVLLERALRTGDGDLPGLPEPDAGDVLAGSVSIRTRLLQEHAAVMAGFETDLLESPAIATVAAVLEPDEAALVLGTHWSGTLVAVITSRDDATPSHAEISDEWRLREWIDLVRGEDGDGWLLALDDPDSRPDPSRVLREFAAAVDGMLQTLSVRIAPLGIRRLVVIPHSLLHLIPFAALSSFAGLDLLLAASCAQFVTSRRQPPSRLVGRAVVVSNPTGDLRVSSAEAAAARAGCEHLGLDPEVIEGEHGTPEHVAAAAAGCALLHVSAHGHAEVTEPERAALLLSPGPLGEDPIAALLAGVDAWMEYAGDEDVRWATLPLGGRMYERQEESGAITRWTDGLAPNLLARYLDGAPIRISAPWSAGDLLVNDTLRGCGLAVLSSCSAGLPWAGATDEAGGLPAAFQLAGADSVVATLWPVSEPVAALWTEDFYAALDEQDHRVARVAQAVRTASLHLAGMTRDEAQARLERLAAGATDPGASHRMRVFARRLAPDAEQPFSDPWEWAGFFATGAGRLTREGATQ